MNAIISGQEGIAIFGEDNCWWMIRVNDDTIIEWSSARLQHTFGGSLDQQYVRDTTLVEVRRMLAEACARVEARQLALNLLDPDLSDETRLLVAEDLEELLGKGTEAAVRAMLFARPLIADVHDLEGALRLELPPRVNALYNDLKLAQRRWS